MKVICEKVLVKVQKEPEQIKTASGLSLPNPNTAAGISKATVINSDYEKVSEGDTVLVYKDSGTEFTASDNERYRTISAADIIVVL